MQSIVLLRELLDETMRGKRLPFPANQILDKMGKHTNYFKELASLNPGDWKHKYLFAKV